MKHATRKSPFLLLILLSLSVLIISGCNPVKEEAVVVPEPTEEVSSPALAACNATEKTPGGGFAMCAPVNCDDLSGSFPVTYNSKEPVASCSMEAVVGICTVDGVDKTYYAGEPDSLKSGCGFSNGDWSVP